MRATWISSIIIVMALVGCGQAQTISRATKQEAALLVTLKPKATATLVPTVTASYTPTMAVTATATASPTPEATATLIAATAVVGYSYQDEARGAVTLRHTDGTIQYLVGGKTAEEIEWQMSVLGPRDDIGHFVWFGLTTPLYDATPICECGEGGCRASAVVVDLLVTYMIPHWSEVGMEHDPLSAYWAFFEGALLGHEKGHGKIAGACGWQMGEAILALPAAATCEEINAGAQNAVIASQQACRAEHRAYDDETGHGATQGVVWPPDMGR